MDEEIIEVSEAFTVSHDRFPDRISSRRTVSNVHSHAHLSSFPSFSINDLNFVGTNDIGASGESLRFPD
jgi:hypothetical protein